MKKDSNKLISIVIPSRNRPLQLKKLLESIKQSTYKSYEIIIINDSSKDNKKYITLSERYGARLLTNSRNEGLAYSRNAGAKAAKGDFVLFIDDDNIIDKDMILELVNTWQIFPNAIAAGPINYYASIKNRICFLSVNFSLATSRPHFINKVYKKNLLNNTGIQTESLHNCFMIKKVYGKRVGWFDERLFMSGTEFDMFKRIKKLFPKGQILTNIYARCYHDIAVLQENLKNFARIYGQREARVYYLQRNRAVLVGRYGNFSEKLIFTLIFYPFFFSVYSLIFIIGGRRDLFWLNFKGTIVGYINLLHLPFLSMSE